MSELLKINVNEHTEKKGQLTYLSWAWAWAEVLKIDSQASWRLMQLGDSLSPAFFMPDGSAMVGVAVTIKGDMKSCVLPVMDNRNKAIKNPDAFAINTAIMRCLAKAIAMHGLGLYIYAGEDLPEGDAPAEAEPPKLAGVIHKPTDGMLSSLTTDMQTYIHDLADEVEAKFKDGQDKAYDHIEDANLENDLKVALWSLLPSNVRSALKREGDARKKAA
jgi:hypothetical protein